MQKGKKSIIAVAFMLVLSIMLSACAQEKSDSDGKKDGKSDKPQDLVFAVLSDAVGIDAHGTNDVPSSNIGYNIYETLVYHDENNEIQPLLAESWERVDDLTWEFKLREGVKFHDGSDFNAEVVKANLERIQDPDIASQRAFLFEMINDIKVIDDYTIQLKTEYSFSPLLSHLSHSGGGMMSLESIKKDYEAMENGDNPGTYINKHPTGTGYFKFEEWVPGQHIKLVRNDDYWGEKAKLDSVTFKVVGEDATRIAELQSKNAHITFPVSPSDVDRVDGLDNASIHRQPSTSIDYVGFNAEKEPFNDVKVRQAISMAIDKEGIISGIWEDTGIPATGPIAPDVFGYDDSVKPLPYDPEKAKELLAEAGYADGFKTTIWTNDNAQRVDTAVYVQAKLKEIGIEVKVEELEWGAFLEKTAKGEHDMFILGWSTPTLDADYATYPLFHSKNVGDPGNRTFLKDDKLDKILTDAREEADEKKRKALYRDAQEKLVELAPMVYIHHQEYLLGVDDSVKNFWIDSGGIYRLQDVSIE